MTVKIRAVRVLGAEHAVIQGLRDAGSETELTRVLASIFRADPHVAADFVRLVLSAAPGAQSLDLDTLPDSLRCRAEERLRNGRIDLSFRDDAGRWQVLVEIKRSTRMSSGPCSCPSLGTCRGTATTR